MSKSMATGAEQQKWIAEALRVWVAVWQVCV